MSLIGLFGNLLKPIIKANLLKLAKYKLNIPLNDLSIEFIGDMIRYKLGLPSRHSPQIDMPITV